MFSKLVTKFAVYLLNKATLSKENHALLSTCVLDKLVALPFRDIIVYNEEGNLLVNGNPLDLEKMRLLRESARAALSNQALKIIRDQVAYEAIKIGVHQAQIVDQMVFGKSAIWWGEQELKHLLTLAQMDSQ